METGEFSARQVLELTEQLAVIPAPSGREEQRTAYCLRWLQKHLQEKRVFADEVGNVCAEFGDTEHDPIVLLMAHTDIVFDRETPLLLRREGDRLYCPGIGDDTVHVAMLLHCAGWLSMRPPRKGLSFVCAANVCEEGEGNLRGCRSLMERYGSRLREVISFDSVLSKLNTDAVGSMRYRITAETGGGHSFRDFGADNAIALLASLVAALDRQPLPAGGVTTYNFGRISGGTTVNSIAARAELLYEFRSDRHANLLQMERQLVSLTAELDRRCRKNGGTLQVESIGVRPCAKGVDPVAQEALIQRAEAAFDGLPKPVRAPASTDCNLPLSMGIPAVCIGLVDAGGAHTTSEYIRPDSISDGVEVALRLLRSYEAL